MSESERKIKYFQSELTGDWYFRVVADNGEIVSASEGYKRKEDMFDTLAEYYSEWMVEKDDEA